MLTLASFKERIDAQLLIELTDPNGAAIDDVKLQHALDDAWSDIRGYTFRLSEDATPETATLDSHQFTIAMYRIAGNRPGTEFESIAARYKASIRFLEGLRNGDDDVGVVADGTADDPIFDAESLEEMGTTGVPK